jgi:hypothetical protein
MVFRIGPSPKNNFRTGDQDFKSAICFWMERLISRIGMSVRVGLRSLLGLLFMGPSFGSNIHIFRSYG